MGEFESSLVRTRDTVKRFHLLNNSQTLPMFSPVEYEGTENMFYFFYKIIIFQLNKEKDDIQSAAQMYNFISFMRL